MRDTPLCDAIYFWAKSKESRTGKRPSYIVMDSVHAEIFWKETYDFIMKKPDMKFENPVNKIRQFMGMNILITTETHGGSFDWGFAE